MFNLFEIKYFDNRDSNYESMYVVAETMSDAVKSFENKMSFDPVSCTELKDFSSKIIVSDE